MTTPTSPPTTPVSPTRSRSKSFSGETRGRVKVGESVADEKVTADMQRMAEKLEMELRIGELVGEVGRLRAKCDMQEVEYVNAIKREREEKTRLEKYVHELKAKMSVMQGKLAAKEWVEGQSTTRYKYLRFGDVTSYSYAAEEDEYSTSTDETESTADTEPIQERGVPPTDSVSDLDTNLRADLFDLFTEYLTSPTSDSLTPKQVEACWERMEAVFHLPPEPCPPLPKTPLPFIEFLRVMVNLNQRVRKQKELQTIQLSKLA